MGDLAQANMHVLVWSSTSERESAHGEGEGGVSPPNQKPVSHDID